jgi:hypothetical protein
MSGIHAAPPATASRYSFELAKSTDLPCQGSEPVRFGSVPSRHVTLTEVAVRASEESESTSSCAAMRASLPVAQ